MTTKPEHIKKIFFFIITLCIPLIILILIELTLRIFHFGDDLNLILTTQKKGITYYQLNQNIGKKYFSKTDERLIPQLYPQQFEFQKSVHTFRIFLLGGSTMAGFPYELNARINSLLKDRLSTYYPDTKFEIINVGLSAINSFTVLDFARELVKYDPDLFLIYMGHNEFYGALGVGSLEHFGKHPVVIRSYLLLNRLKLFQLLRQLMRKIVSIQSNTSLHSTDRTLMASMAEKRSIPLNSKDYRLAKRYFRENLSRIITMIKKHHYPVLVSTIFSNIKHQPPFVSLHADTLSALNRARWDHFYTIGLSQLTSGELDSARINFDRALKIDAMPAKLHYQRGKCFLTLNDTIEAKAALETARDLDALRFRAPTEFNRIIQEICERNKIPMTDMESIFSRYSPRGIIGNTLITEHLHPNFDGYLLMAKSFADDIVEHSFIKDDPVNLFVNEQYFRKLSHVTILDQAIGDVMIQKLTSAWPYQQPVSVLKYPNVELKAVVEKLVHKYQQGQISWNDAHYKLAQHFVEQNRYDSAIDEYLSVAKILPDNYFPPFKIGNLYFRQNNLSQAAYWLQQALKRSDKAFIRAKLGMVYLRKKAVPRAITEFVKALTLDTQTEQLTKDEKLYAHYYLAICYLKMNRTKKAMQHLNEVIRINPRHKEALNLLSLIRSHKKIDIQL